MNPKPKYPKPKSGSKRADPSLISILTPTSWRDLKAFIPLPVVFVFGPTGEFKRELANAIAYERNATIDPHDTAVVFRAEQRGVLRLNVCTALVAAGVPFVGYGTGTAESLLPAIKAWREQIRDVGLPVPVIGHVSVSGFSGFRLPWRSPKRSTR